MRIRVCLPFYSEYVSTLSGVTQLQNCNEHEFVIVPRQGTYVGDVRNSLINDLQSREKFQDPVDDFDAFLTVDSDIDFTLDNVLKLISHDKDIVASPYLMHNKFDYACGSLDIVNGNMLNMRWDLNPEGLQKVDYVGAGFVLIKRNVFQRTAYPWYRHILISFEENGKECQTEIWEDIGFCVTAKKYGFATWCDFDNPVKHINRKKMDRDEQVKNMTFCKN